MNSCNLFCELFYNIQWVWYLVSVLVVFGIGAIWYSLLFSKLWIRIFKVEIPEEVKPSNMIRPLLIQFFASALFGLVLFLAVKLSVWLAILILAGFSAWIKASLSFQFIKWKDFVWAATIQAGYAFIAGIVFILFGII